MFFAAFTAYGREMWIEYGWKDQPEICFGQKQSGAQEQVRSSLDPIAGVQTWYVSSLGRKKNCAYERAKDCFRVNLPAGKYDTVLARADQAAVEGSPGRGLGGVKPMYYARCQTEPLPKPRPLLELDIVPLNFKGTDWQFRVYFRGKPLAGKELTLFFPSTTPNSTIQTDSRGVATLRAAEYGLWLLEVTYVENKAGSFRGKPYRAIRHRATCTVFLPPGC
jgi:hypothetical protein